MEDGGVAVQPRVAAPNVPQSAMYCDIALRIVVTSAFLVALRASAKFFAGLIAIIVIAAKIAISATTTKISIRVKPAYFFETIMVSY